MRPQVVILSGGRDSELLRVRNEILKVPGFTVVSAYSPEELMAIFRAGDFDVVLLCHSFSNDEQSELALAIHAQSPSTPVMVMTTGERTNAFADFAVKNDPASLLNAITGATARGFPDEGREQAS